MNQGLRMKASARARQRRSRYTENVAHQAPDLFNGNQDNRDLQSRKVHGVGRRRLASSLPPLPPHHPGQSACTSDCYLTHRGAIGIGGRQRRRVVSASAIDETVGHGNENFSGTTLHDLDPVR